MNIEIDIIHDPDPRIREDDTGKIGDDRHRHLKANICAAEAVSTSQSDAKQ